MTVAKKELFSEKVSAGSRTFFFDVKESAEGTTYLVISESRQSGEKPFEHSRVMVFEEHRLAFHKGFEKALQFLEQQNKSKTYDVQEIRREYPKAYAKWTKEEDALLSNEYSKRVSELADSFQRRPGAIRSRLQKLGLLGE